MSLENRIKVQFPGLIITFLSVIIGVGFGDLVQLAREQANLWPLDLAVGRTWGQIFTMLCCGLSVWIVFAHVGISRLRIPTLADSVVVFLSPLMILAGNSLVGKQPPWLWTYWASAYLTVGIASWHWQIRMACAELPAFARLARPTGPLIVLYIGAPYYFAMAWADSHRLLGPVAEMVVAVQSGPLAMLTTWMFFRDWHRAIAQSMDEGA